MHRPGLHRYQQKTALGTQVGAVSVTFFPKLAPAGGSLLQLAGEELKCRARLPSAHPDFQKLQ